MSDLTTVSDFRSLLIQNEVKRFFPGLDLHFCSMFLLLGLWVVPQLADEMQFSEIGSVHFFFRTGIWCPGVLTARGH